MSAPLRERIRLEERRMMVWLVPACVALALLIVIGSLWGETRERQRYVEAQNACAQQGREAMVMPMPRDRDLLFCRDANGALYDLPKQKTPESP